MKLRKVFRRIISFSLAVMVGIGTCLSPVKASSLEGVTEYWNPVGGREFFNCEKYTNSSIEIWFQKMYIEEYRQKNNAFEPGLSIIDVMMFNSSKKINQMLDNYELVSSI